MFLYIVIERRKYNRPGFKSPWTDTELYRIPVRPEVLKGLAEPLDGLRIMVGSLVNRHPGVYGVFPFRDPSTTTNLVKVVMTPASTPVDEESLVEVLAVAFGPRDKPKPAPSKSWAWEAEATYFPYGSYGDYSYYYNDDADDEKPKKSRDHDDMIDDWDR